MISHLILTASCLILVTNCLTFITNYLYDDDQLPDVGDQFPRRGEHEVNELGHVDLVITISISCQGRIQYNPLLFVTALCILEYIRGTRTPDFTTCY